MRLTKSNQKLGSLNKPSISKSEKYKQLVGDVKKISEAIDNYRNHKTNYFAACKKWRMVDCTMRKISSFKAHEKKIYDCKFSHHNPDLVISVANDKKLKYWNVHDKKLLKEFDLESPWITSCNISDDEALTCVTDLQKNCTIYNLREETKAPVEILSGHKDYVNCSAFLSSGKLLTASGDGAAILWDVATGKESAAFIEHESGVICLDASKNSGLFATGGYDTYSKLWDVRQKESICNFSGNNSDVNAVKLFPGDRALAVASDDATCKLFDLRSFRLLNTYEHESVISTLTALLFSKSGHYLFALSEGGQLVTWDLLSGKLLDLQHGEEKLSCMDINCEGDALVVGSWDESLSVWTNDCHHGQRTLIIDPSVKEE